MIINKIILELFDIRLDNKEYEFLSDFTFLWGIFESKFRKNKSDSLNYVRIREVIDLMKFKVILNNIDSLNSLPDRIMIKSTEDDFIFSTTNVDFSVSLFPIEIKKEFNYFKTYLGNNNHTIKSIEKNNPQIIFLICFIAYRLRNNLFHGNKSFHQLYQQKNLFEMINNFLVEILIKTKDINFQVD